MAGLSPLHFHTGTKKTRSTLSYSTKAAGDLQRGQSAASRLSTVCTSRLTPPKKKKNTIFLSGTRNRQQDYARFTQDYATCDSAIFLHIDAKTLTNPNRNLFLCLHTICRLQLPHTMELHLNTLGPALAPWSTDEVQDVCESMKMNPNCIAERKKSIRPIGPT